MGRKFRFCAHSLLRALPSHTKSPANLQEAGLLPFEIIQLPERSCKWPHFFVKVEGIKVDDAKNSRLSHPFVVITMRMGKICGMGCTSDPRIHEFAKLPLPSGDTRSVRWSNGLLVRDTYVALNTWILSYSELLFQNEGQPRKIGAILDKALQATINKFVVAPSQALGKQP